MKQNPGETPWPVRLANCMKILAYIYTCVYASLCSFSDYKYPGICTDSAKVSFERFSSGRLKELEWKVLVAPRSLRPVVGWLRVGIMDGRLCLLRISVRLV